MFTGPIVESQALSCQFGVREGEAVYDFAWFPSMNSQGDGGLVPNGKILTTDK